MNLAHKKRFMPDTHQDVNYVRHWNYISEMMPDIEGFTPAHMSLYNAIFQTWNSTGFKVWFDAYRDELMRLSMIKSRATYHKTLKEIEQAGLIEYRSNKSIYKASNVRCIRFDDVQEIGSFSSEIEQEKDEFKASSNNELDEVHTKFTRSSNNEPNSGTHEVHTKFTRSSNIEHFPKHPKLSKQTKVKKNIVHKSDLSEKRFVKPSLEDVFTHMLEKGLQEKEAEYLASEYIDYYESNGWRVGRNKMKLWKSAASNWIRNADKFDSNWKQKVKKAMSVGASTGSLLTDRVKEDMEYHLSIQNNQDNDYDN